MLALLEIMKSAFEFYTFVNIIKLCINQSFINFMTWRFQSIKQRQCWNN